MFLYFRSKGRGAIEAIESLLSGVSFLDRIYHWDSFETKFMIDSSQGAIEKYGTDIDKLHHHIKTRRKIMIT